MKLITKYSSLLLIFFVCQKATLSQSVRFTCYMKSQCLNEPTQIKKYTLSNSDTTFFSDDSGVCNVTLLGAYSLYSSELIAGVESPQFSFTHFGSFKDTVQSWALYPILLIDGKSSKGLKTGDWLYCDNRCNGYYTDYYYNGNKRMEGKFKKGKPVGELKFYSESGKLKYVEYYSKRGRKIRSEYK